MDVKPIQSPNFTAIRVPGFESMPGAVYDAVKSSKAVNKFGKKYNAEINYVMMGSSKDNKIAHPALIINNISPVNIFNKLLNKFRGIPNEGQFFYFTTHGTEESDLCRKLAKIDENYLINKYEGFFKK